MTNANHHHITIQDRPFLDIYGIEHNSTIQFAQRMLMDVNEQVCGRRLSYQELQDIYNFIIIADKNDGTIVLTESQWASVKNVTLELVKAGPRPLAVVTLITSFELMPNNIDNKEPIPDADGEPGN